MERVFIVAEIGCNHNGDYELAKKLVVEAKKCGVDGVKFQTFKADALIAQSAPKAMYQIANTGDVESQLEMTRKLELPADSFLQLRDFAKSLGLVVFSTPFDLQSIRFLQENGQNIWKIPSGEITNLPYLERIRDLRCGDKWIILSTGMSTLEEIRTAIDILDAHKHRITVLHCNTEYPTMDDDVNISAIMDLKAKLPDLEIGFSDHSVGTVAATMAVAYGIHFIEKHFTLDKNLPGPDHKASATPAEMIDLVKNVRRAERILGCGQKIVTDSEQKNIVVARKSIIANRDIQEGEPFSEDNLTCKRPGNGISPMRWYDLLGKRAKHTYSYDELIQYDELKL